MIGHRDDGVPDTAKDRLTDALVLIAPLSYGNQVLKSANWIAELAFNSKSMSEFDRLASKPLTTLLSTGGRGTSFALAVGTKALIPLLDLAGGVVAGVLGAMQIKHGKETGDKVVETSGWFMTVGGGLWAAGGLASFAFSALAAPFFVLSGVSALIGLVTSMAGNPGIAFADSFSGQFGSLESMGIFRADGKDNLEAWYNENYVDTTNAFEPGI